MAYLEPKERMKISIRPEVVKASGLPYYTSYQAVPKGLYTKTACKRMRKSVKKNEKPVAYVLARLWNGYLPLYKREV